VQHSGDLAADDQLLLAWMAQSLVHGIAKLALSKISPNVRAILEFPRTPSGHPPVA
jgi:hypothetical protein